MGVSATKPSVAGDQGRWRKGGWTSPKKQQEAASHLSPLLRDCIEKLQGGGVEKRVGEDCVESASRGGVGGAIYGGSEVRCRPFYRPRRIKKVSNPLQLLSTVLTKCDCSAHCWRHPRRQSTDTISCTRLLSLTSIRDKQGFCVYSRKNTTASSPYHLTCHPLKHRLSMNGCGIGGRSDDTKTFDREIMKDLVKKFGSCGSHDSIQMWLD